MAVGRPHFHIRLILSVKILFTKNSLREGCGWELGGKVLESWLSSELNCVTSGKSLTSLCFSLPPVNGSNTYLTGLLWGLIRDNVCKAFKVLEEGAI